MNLCLTIQGFQEAVHSQSYSYMLDSICSPVERDSILYQWKEDEHLLRRNTFIGDLYNEFQEKKDDVTLLQVMMANYILEGIYFYSGFMFFITWGRKRENAGKRPGDPLYQPGREHPSVAVPQHDPGTEEGGAAAVSRQRWWRC